MEREAEARLLACPGAVFVGRNLRFRVGEIDLVLEERLPGGAIELVFVEVRYRAQGSPVSALESVNPEKQRRLKRAIQLFLMSYRGRARSLRVDIMAKDGDTWSQVRNVSL